MKLFLKIIVLFVCWQITISVYAQKLPAIQKASLYAPNNKPEKLLTAPSNKFQAYNKGNHLYYTIANDADNMYLVVHTADRLTIQKIIGWGLALRVSNSGKINKGSPCVSFPTPDEDSNLMITRGDATKIAYNSKMANMCKLIAVNNLAGINGPTISVYNNEGIKAKATFNDKLEYSYELTVPLKYLNVSAKDKSRFKYNIKLNGRVSNTPGVPAAPVSNSGTHSVYTYSSRNQENPASNYLFSPTNFSGDCILVAN